MIWKLIPNSCYEASETGEIRRVGSECRFKHQEDHNGYATVALWLVDRRVTFKVHRLICFAFHGMSPDWATLVRHLNGNKKDNHPNNLAWGTAKQNAQDSIAHGVQVRGRLHPSAVGEIEHAMEIRRLYLKHMRGRRKAANGFVLSLVGRFDYSYKTTYRMCTGEHHATKCATV